MNEQYLWDDLLSLKQQQQQQIVWNIDYFGELNQSNCSQNCPHRTVSSWKTNIVRQED